MNGGTPPSPEDISILTDGVEVCHFQIVYSNTAPNPYSSIIAWNAPTSPYTNIEVRQATTNALSLLPLPTSGAKETTGPRTGWFKRTVSQAAINSAGFTNYGDIGSYTVS